MTLSPDDTRPESVRVADAIRAQITSGELRAGDRVPSVRSLAEQFGVAEMTAQKAIEIIRAEDLIITRPGKGSFVRDSAEAPTPAGPSAQFAALSSHIDAIDSTVKELAERLQALESEFRSAQRSSRPPTK